MNVPYGSPEGPDYFPLTPRTKQASRWKEDWEELELLVGVRLFIEIWRR